MYIYIYIYIYNKRLQREACERYQNLSEEEKDKNNKIHGKTSKTIYEPEDFLTIKKLFEFFF